MILTIASVVLGAVVMLTFCLLIVYDTVNGRPYNFPDAFLVLLSVISGVLFGSHATANGTQQTAAKLVDALQRSTPQNAQQPSQ